MNDSIATQGSYVDAYAPPTQTAPAPTSITEPSTSAEGSSTSTSSTSSEALSDQNIFDMLGVASGTEEQKEAFLDELQQVIWEDFLEHDAQLLISTEDYTQLKTMIAEKPVADLQQQEKIVVFLEKLIPDLEDIMLEKALELKGDLFRERISGLREFFAGQAEKLQGIDRAEQQMQADQWGSAAQTLNQL